MAPDSVEITTLLGSGARFVARVLLYGKYFISFRETARLWKRHPYSQKRWGPRSKWRPWLLWDAAELEQLEKLLNYGMDEDLRGLQSSHLDTFGLVAVTACFLSATNIAYLLTPPRAHCYLKQPSPPYHFRSSKKCPGTHGCYSL